MWTWRAEYTTNQVLVGMVEGLGFPVRVSGPGFRVERVKN